MKNAELIARFNRLNTDRNNVEQMWDAITKFITPYRGRFFKEQDNEDTIEWTQRWIYDGTAVGAHQTLASSLHGALTSPSIRWFDMRFRDNKLNENKRAAAWMQEVVDLVYYEFQDSNFNLEINESYQDLVGMGTSFMTLERKNDESPSWSGLNFCAVPLKEAFGEYDANGRLARFYRHLKWTPTEIISKFGDSVPQAVKDAEKGKSSTRMDVLFVVTPRGNEIKTIAEMNRKKAPSKRAWEYRYIFMPSSETLGKPGGYYEMPAYAARWRKTSESQWGNSPAMLALADVLTLNEARKMQLSMAEKIIDPPTLAEERALLSDLDMSAGALNTVRNADGIKQFESRGSFPVSDAMVTQLQQSVKDYFFIDALRMPPPQAQPMTATEIMARQEQMQRELGPTLGRISADMLDPLITRAVKMLARAGRLPEAPPIVKETDAQWDIQYLGSLQRAQRMDNAQNIERWVMSGANMAQVLPDALDIIDAHEIMRYLGRDLSIPAMVMRDKAEVQERKDARDAEAAKAAEAAQGKMAGEAAMAQGEGAQAMAAGQAAVNDAGGM